MSTSNPYTDLAAVMRKADATVAELRALPTLKPAQRRLLVAAAHASDAADAILDLADSARGMDTLARTAASTLGRILKGLEAAAGAASFHEGRCRTCSAFVGFVHLPGCPEDGENVTPEQAR